MSYYTADEILGAMADDLGAEAPAGPDTVFEPMVVTQSAPRAGRSMSVRQRPGAAAVSRMSPGAVRAAVAQADVQRAAEAAASGEGGYYLPDVQPTGKKGVPNWAIFTAGGVGLLGLGFLGYRVLKGRR